MPMFSVMLLYPRSVRDGDAENYFTSVEALDVSQAVHAAREECLDSNQFDPEDFAPEDFEVLLVIAGRHEDLTVELDDVHRPWTVGDAAEPGTDSDPADLLT